ncbi:MAG: hypothetical protein ABIQ31_09260 [Ferruginibacter sp.]
MKTLIFYLLAAIGTLPAFAQQGERIFKRFKGDVSAGFAMPMRANANGGVLFALEPKFALMDNLSVGVRLEGAVTARFNSSDNNGNTSRNDARVEGSRIATADYYFTNKYAFRPFVGGGAGVFTVADHYESFDAGSAVSKFGGLIRAGFESKHFRFGLEYNIIPGVIASQYNTNTGTTTFLNVTSSYFGVKFGFCFGGGPL